MSSLRTGFEPDPRLYPFRSRFMDTPWGRLHYLDEGTGRPIVLMHGNPTWSFVFRDLIGPLVAGGFRCIAPDLLGYGLSEHPTNAELGASDHAQVVAELVTRLDLNDAVVLGQDWGGPIILGAAVEVAPRIGGVVVGSTFAWRASGFVELVARILRTQRVQRWMVEGETFIARSMRHLAQRPLSSEELAHYVDVFETPALRRSLSVLARELLDAGDWLDTLQARIPETLGHLPALLVFGAREGALGKRALARFARMFSDHVQVRLPTAGHFFQHDAPQEVAAAILERFASAPDRVSARPA